jgi:tripartite-type tricarboxylate transporter receptor subunit TctC
MKAGRILRVTMFALAVLAAWDVAAQEWQEWKPDRPIQIVVPWGAGGASDTVARMIAGIMWQSIGQPMTVVNKPGGAGAFGTREVWGRPHDGYTLTANSTVSIGSYAVLGKLEQTHRDWLYWLPIFAPNVICVKGDSPIETVEELVALMKSRPGAVILSSAGVGSSGYFGAEIFKEATGATYRHVSYSGGADAVIAVARGEADVVMQLSVEVADLLRAGKLKALAVSSKSPLTIEGYGKIPSITGTYPSFPGYGSFFGLLGPADLPGEVAAAYDDAFARAAASPAVRDYARDKGALPVALYGKDAADLAERLARKEAWILFDSGVAVRSPASLDIPRQ